MGVFTATVLVSIAACFPSLEDIGVDLGMRLNVALTNSGIKSLAIEPYSPDGEPFFRYVFIDVDPGGSTVNSTYRTDDDICRVVMKDNSTLKNLECHPTRPLNRIVLAKVLEKLIQLNDRHKEGSSAPPGILAIAIDVILKNDSVAKDEDNELRRVMKNAVRTLPILYGADAYQPSFGETDEQVKLESNKEKDYPGEPSVVLPVADSAIRRYHRCFSSIESKQRLQSLPFQLARTAHHNLLECGKNTDPSGHPYNERIIYTLPPLGVHADFSPKSDKDRKALERAKRYDQIYVHCFAAHLWAPSSPCTQPEAYNNSIVVIGASNPVRRDRHYTPLGMMSGAELVINATRSFLLYPDQVIPNGIDKLRKKVGITFACSFVWLTYYLISHRRKLRRNKQLSPWIRLRTCVVQLLLFLGTLIVVVILAVGLSFMSGPPNLDILLPVLVIALEQYTECAMWLLRSTKTRLAQLFGCNYTHVERNHPRCD